MAKKGTVNDRFKAMSPAAQIFSVQEADNQPSGNIDKTYVETSENIGEIKEISSKSIAKGNKKKQLNVALPDEQVAILKEAARLTNRTMTQVIGALIMDKYRSEWKDMFAEMNQYK